MEKVTELAAAEKERAGRVCAQCGKEIDPVKLRKGTLFSVKLSQRMTHIYRVLFCTAILNRNT